MQHNQFLHNLDTIPLLNIDSDIMYGKISPRLINIPSIRGIEATHMFESNEKWLLITIKLLKNRVQLVIDKVIRDCNIPESIAHPSGRVPSKIVSEALVSYTAML